MSRPCKLILLTLTACCCGCNDPIYSTARFSPTIPAIELTADNPNNYDWPLTREGYVVAKPPQMAYMTSFSERLKTIDPVAADLVPWDETDLDEHAREILRHAYTPHSEKPNVVLSLANEQFRGPQAFDMSVDGKRLVAIDDKGLALYNANDGTLIGHLALPGKLATADPPVNAVRFCGSTNDILVASAERLVRISSKDGSVMATSPGCGDTIAQWIVNDDDKAMVIRTESGKLFGGDPGLEYFSAYNVGDETFDSVGLSPDGSRLCVSQEGRARTYLQQNFQLVDYVDHTSIELFPEVSVTSGAYTDVWADGDGILFTQANGDGPRRTGGYRMLWQPLIVSQATDDPATNWLLVVGRRWIGDGEQTILFEHGTISQNHSLPVVLDEVPQRMSHSRIGANVALLGSEGITVIKRDVYRSPIAFRHRYWLSQWIKNDDIETIVRLLKIIRSQNRVAFGKPSVELYSEIIRDIGEHWRYLDENEPEGDSLKNLEKWRDSGDVFALTASALRNYRLAWRARGSGYAHEITQEGHKGYQEFLQATKEDLDLALKHETPPLLAFELAVQHGLETQGELEAVDGICRRAMELYPGEVDPHASLAYKLLPQWYGEFGDVMSYFLSLSKMVEGASGDVLYFRLVALRTFDVYRHPGGWRSYDAKRIERGFDEYVRRKLNDGNSDWAMFFQLHERARNPEMGDRVLKHKMKHCSSHPYAADRQNNAVIVNAIERAASRIRGQ